MVEILEVSNLPIDVHVPFLSSVLGAESQNLTSPSFAEPSWKLKVILLFSSESYIEILGYWA